MSLSIVPRPETLADLIAHLLGHHNFYFLEGRQYTDRNEMYAAAADLSAQHTLDHNRCQYTHIHKFT